MLVKTIQSYRDKDTKAIYRTTDNCTIREVSNKRGAELIAAGVVIEVVSDAISKPVKGKGKNTEKNTEVENKETPAEQTETEDVEAPAEGEAE